MKIKKKSMEIENDIDQYPINWYEFNLQKQQRYFKKKYFRINLREGYFDSFVEE